MICTVAGANLAIIAPAVANFPFTATGSASH
jgi:hypothetical protein